MAINELNELIPKVRNVGAEYGLFSEAYFAVFRVLLVLSSLNLQTIKRRINGKKGLAVTAMVASIGVMVSLTMDLLQLMFLVLT